MVQAWFRCCCMSSIFEGALTFIYAFSSRVEWFWLARELTCCPVGGPMFLRTGDYFETVRP